ncbi:MAG TPA: hypothetical protein VFY36_10880 [Solirubrobacteraceae bacterium]|nr:hypothetical protein [Solirubrobacteraceae bacterium]
MNRMRLLGLALVVAGTFSASAEAASGPSYYVNGKSLKTGETRLALIVPKEAFVFAFSTIKIRCDGLTAPGYIEGVALGSGGKGKETFEFTKCTVEGNGEGCEIEGEKFVMASLTTTLGFSKAERMGPVLILFQPVSAIIHFTPTAKCVFSSMSVTGQFIGEAYEGGKPVEVDLTKLGIESLHGEVRFRSPGPKTIWLENGGTLKTVKTKLETGLGALTISGTELVLVDEGGILGKWGIFW